MAEEIIQQDALAALVGSLGRDLATGGSGRLLQLGTFIVGWSYAKGLERIVCGQPVDPLGFAANTLVLVVGIRGGTSTVNLPALPLGFKSIAGPGGSASLSVVATQAIAVVIPTAKLAGAVAGQPGVLVLMAQEGQGSGGGGSSHFDDILTQPNQLGGKTSDEIENLFTNDSRFEIGTMRQGRHAGTGLIVRERGASGQYTGRLIEYHPGTPRHFNGQPYWKVNNGSRNVWVDESGQVWSKPPSREFGTDVPGIPLQ